MSMTMEDTDLSWVEFSEEDEDIACSIRTCSSQAIWHAIYTMPVICKDFQCDIYHCDLHKEEIQQTIRGATFMWCSVCKAEVTSVRWEPIR